MVSIIIPIFNQEELTQECLQAIRDTTAPDQTEVIIIDNGSTPPFVAPFAGFTPIKVIRNESNLGFPVAVNQGIRESSGSTIVLLNNDCIVTPNAISNLSASLDDFAIVGPVTNYCAGIQQVQVPVYNTREQLFDEAENWSKEHEDEICEVNWLIGFCMAFRRSLYDEIGPFDESNWPCSGEELIFCLEARKRNYHVAVIADVYVHHYGSQTFNEMEESGKIKYLDICKRNEKLVAERYGANFWNEQRYLPEPVAGVRLNMGCGQFHMEGFINIDQFEDVNPDLVCNITSVPYEFESVSEIYAGHVLEHFRFDEGTKILRYWHSLLIPGGIISIVVPDYDFLVKQYAANPSPEALIIFNDTYIYSGIQPSPHQYAYSAALLEKVMLEAGFKNLQRMPIDHHYFPFAVDWQVGIQATK